MVGASRKGFIRATAGTDAAAIESATTAVSAIAIAAGVAIVRVHDVKPMRDVVRMVEAIRHA